MRAASPIERFLGAIDHATGPYGLLGLDAAPADEPAVNAALERRLLRLSKHPQAASAEAEEVRLALHVAAAQLRSPSVQQEILARLRRPAPPPAPASAPASRPLDRQERLAYEEFRDLAAQVIAHSGGWSDIARRRLAMLAHTYGLDLTHLRTAVLELARPMPAPARAPAPPPSPTAPRAAAAPKQNRRFLLASIPVFVLAVLAFALLAAILDSRATVATDRQRDAPQATIGEAVDPLAPTDAAGASGGGAIARGGSVVDRLRNAMRSMRDDRSAALAVVDETVDTFLATWTVMPAEQLAVYPAELASFFFLAERELDRQESMRRVARLAEPLVPDSFDADPLAAIGAAGLLARLNREDHPSTIENLLRSRLAALTLAGRGAGATTFGEGVASALGYRVRARLLEPPADQASWTTWTTGADALRRIDPDAERRLCLRLLEAAMRAGRDPAGDQTLHEAIRRLAGRLTAGPADEQGAPLLARRLIAWLDDPSAPTAGLSLIITRLAVGGLVPGSPSEILLDPEATAAERRAVRDTIAARFGIVTFARDTAMVDAIRAQASSLLAEGPADQNRLLTDLAAAAWLNAAAARQWSGAPAEEVQAALDRAAAIDRAGGSALDLVRFNAQDLATLTAPAGAGDGDWAIRFLNERTGNAPRRALLNTLANRGGPRGPADADVLAFAALTGPRPVRETAQQVVVQFGDSLVVLNGLRESLIRVRPTPDVSAMLELITLRPLPDTEDPAWPEAARRALIERLLERIARPDAHTRAVQEAVYAAYLTRREPSAPPPTAPRAEELATSPTPHAAALVDRRVLEAERYVEGAWAFTTIEEIARRAEARGRIARGSLQRFVAEQLALAEVTAFLVAAEHPTRSARAAALVDRLTEEAQGAASVLEQARAAEVGLLRVWLLRLGSEGGP